MTLLIHSLIVRMNPKLRVHPKYDYYYYLFFYCNEIYLFYQWREWEWSGSSGWSIGHGRWLWLTLLLAFLLMERTVPTLSLLIHFHSPFLYRCYYNGQRRVKDHTFLLGLSFLQKNDLFTSFLLFIVMGTTKSPLYVSTMYSDGKCSLRLTSS